MVAPRTVQVTTQRGNPRWDCERSWLQLNKRFIKTAFNHRQPLPERLKSLATFSLNLDSFLIQLDAAVGAVQLNRIRNHLLPVVQRQHRFFRTQIQVELEQQQIFLLSSDDLKVVQKTCLTQIFKNTIFPVLTPMAVGPAHPFPHLANLSLNLAVVVADPASSMQRFACVSLPDKVSRFVRLPEPVAGIPDSWVGIPLEEVIIHHLHVLFPGMDVLSCGQFRITRSLHALGQAGSHRRMRQSQHKGTVVRLEVKHPLPKSLQDLLMRSLQVTESQIYPLEGLLNLGDLASLTSLWKN
jgi:polyphosphate kinase